MAQSTLSTNQFLMRVLPADGTLIHCTLRPKGGMLWPNPYDDTAALTKASQRDYSTQQNQFFAVGGYTGKMGQSKNGKPMVLRKATEVVSLKCFFLDIDGKDYNKKDLERGRKMAREDLKLFLKETALPAPNIIVDSGGGYHVYWAFEDAIPMAEWRPIAMAFKRYMKSQKIKDDEPITGDPARVLRLPGTLNHKTNPPTECKVIFSAQHWVDPQEFAAAIADFTSDDDAQPISGMFDPKVVSMLSRPGDIDDLDAGLKDAGLAQMPMVAEQCAVVSEWLDTGGEGASRDEWLGAINLASLCEDSEEWAHKLSEGHETYSYEDTQNELDRVNRKRMEEGTFGGPLCSTFAAYSEKCQRCIHFRKISTPVQLGYPLRRADPAADPATKTSPDADPADTYPDPTFVQGDITVRYKLDDEGGTYAQEVYHQPLSNWRIAKNDLNERVLLVDRKHGRGTTTNTMRFAASSGTAWPTEWAEAGMHGSPNKWKIMGDVVRAWISKLEAANVYVDTQPYGWAADFNSFAINGIAYKADRSTAEAKKPAEFMASQFEPKGTFQKWLWATNSLLEYSKPEHQLMLATSFAAPLLNFRPDKFGSIMGKSQGSARSKTTTLRALRSVWADPSSINSGIDTENAARQTMARQTDIPYCMDEVISEDQKKSLVALLMAASSGKDKARLDATSRNIPTVSIRTMVVATSNHSLSDYVAANNPSDTNAAYYRMLEMDMPEVHRNPQIQKVTLALENNYGYAGILFVQELLENKDIILDEMQKIERTFKFTQEERFWASSIVCSVLGAALARQWLGINFDIKAIVTRCKRLLADSRRAVTEYNTLPEGYASEIFAMFKDRFEIRDKSGSIVTFNQNKSYTALIDYQSDTMYIPGDLCKLYAERLGKSVRSIQSHLSKLQEEWNEEHRPSAAGKRQQAHVANKLIAIPGLGKRFHYRVSTEHVGNVIGREVDE